MAKLPQSEPPFILKVAIAVPLNRLFDYVAHVDTIQTKIEPGSRVEVPFGNGKKIGYVVEICHESDISFDKLKPIERILDEHPLLSSDDLKLIHWASDYYHHPIGEVLSTAFPAALRKGQSGDLQHSQLFYEVTESGLIAQPVDLKRTPKQLQLLTYFQQNHPAVLTETDLADWDKNWRKTLKGLMEKALVKQAVELVKIAEQRTIKPSHSTGKEKNINNPCRVKVPQPNPEQQTAIDCVSKNLGKFAVYLLEGITGSGKTEVYMQIIQSVLDCGQQVLVLVPEINLTPQLEARFRQRFSVAMALFHSNLTDKQRHDAWLRMQKGISSILLGTRSALFTPLKNPGLIILDEEHDSSFKQQEGFRFSARDVAIMRGKLLNIPVLLGSATPSLESLHNANQQRYRHLYLTERAGNAAEPNISLLDIRNKKLNNGLSDVLIDEIRKVLSRKEQVLLFLNRRGFAPTLICHGCGWVARCKHCDANLVIHNHEKRLRCHHCGREQHLLVSCPACKTGELMPLGLGTERVEAALQSIFPDKVLVRLDRDTTQRKGSLERYLSQINEGQADIILGTQMLAKGHHFSDVTLVAIVDVDSGLFSIDYRATERLAQLVVQVSGRAGRAEKKGNVILQTRHPNNPMLNKLIREGYGQYAKVALEERKQASLPPFTYQALLRAHANDRELPFVFLKTVAAIAKTYQNNSIQILGPVPAPMEKRANLHRYQLLLQATNRNILQQCLTRLLNDIENLKVPQKIRWSLDVDPLDLF
ncbi:MAG: primosomal protein N' [Methylococcaceae bacterium]|nr:primosomal protein N' [Methylococcaceae bacterium]